MSRSPLSSATRPLSMLQRLLNWLAKIISKRLIALACLIEATHNAPQNVAGIAARVLASVMCGGEALQQAEAINLKCAGSA